MLHGNRVLVVGASSGIGMCIAGNLARAGYRVYGTSRRGAVALSGSEMPFPRIIKMDVCDATSIECAVESVVSREGGLDIVINCAGDGWAGAVEETSDEEARLQFDTNYFGSVRLVRHVVPLMRKQGRGVIILMGSLAGSIGIPFQAQYCASKFALEGLVEALRHEIRDFGIQVSLVDPGDTRTSFTARRRWTEASREGSPYHRAARRAVGIMERDEQSGADPELVWRSVAALLARPTLPVRVVPGFRYALLYMLKRLLPMRISEAIIARIYLEKGAPT